MSKLNQRMANGENMTHVGAWYRLVTCCGSLMEHDNCDFTERLHAY